MKDALAQILIAINQSQSLALPFLLFVATSMATIDLALFAVKSNLQGFKLFPLIEKFMLISINLYLLTNLKPLSLNLLNQGFLLLERSTGGNINLKEYLLDPMLLINYCQEQVMRPLAEIVQDRVGSRYIKNIHLLIAYGFTWIVVTCSFIVIGVQLVLAMVEFHLLILFGSILYPFQLNQYTKFISSKVPLAIIGQVIKLCILALTTGLGIETFKVAIGTPSETTLSLQYFGTLLACTVLFFLIYMNASGMVNSLMTGSSGFNATSVLGAASRLMMGGAVAASSSMSHAIKANGGIANSVKGTIAGIANKSKTNSTGNFSKSASHKNEEPKNKASSFIKSAAKATLQKGGKL